MDGPVATPEAELRGWRPALRSVGTDLLIYKALFRGAWFASLIEAQEDARVKEVLGRMSAETEAQARDAGEALREWSRGSVDLGDVAGRLHAALLGDLLALKERTAEGFLLVGMRAPTAALRAMFVELADVDRRHADALRDLLGMHRVEHRLADPPRPDPGDPVGAHDRRAPESSFARTVQRVIESMRADGQELARLTLSPVALRHARDEGLVGREDGTMFGLPVDVDFGWRGECFAVHSRDHATLAELITAGRAAARERA